MSAGTLISVEDYLTTSYHPDREYRDGVVLERNAGDYAHSRLLALLSKYIGIREEQWNIEVFVDLRIHAGKAGFPYRIFCVRSSGAARKDSNANAVALD